MKYYIIEQLVINITNMLVLNMIDNNHIKNLYCDDMFEYI